MVTKSNEYALGAPTRSAVPARSRRWSRLWSLRVAGLGLAAAAMTGAVEDAAMARTGAGTAEPTRAAAPHQAVAAARVASILSFARAQLGKPYIWGGVGPRGFDCSGLVKTAFASVGVSLPRGSIAQSSAGRRTSRRDLKPGDLVFSNNYFHVQLYIGDGRVIEAARPGTNVRVSRMLPESMIDAYVRVPLG